jgi:hypothetical protein
MNVGEFGTDTSWIEFGLITLDGPDPNMSSMAR